MGLKSIPKWQDFKNFQERLEEPERCVYFQTATAPFFISCYITPNTPLQPFISSNLLIMIYGIFQVTIFHW